MANVESAMKFAGTLIGEESLTIEDIKEIHLRLCGKILQNIY
jgi:hypothetical protein